MRDRLLRRRDETDEPVVEQRHTDWVVRNDSPDKGISLLFNWMRITTPTPNSKLSRHTRTTSSVRVASNSTMSIEDRCRCIDIVKVDRTYKIVLLPSLEALEEASDRTRRPKDKSYRIDRPGAWRPAGSERSIARCEVNFLATHSPTLVPKTPPCMLAVPEVHAAVDASENDLI